MRRFWNWKCSRWGFTDKDKWGLCWRRCNIFFMTFVKELYLAHTQMSSPSHLVSILDKSCWRKWPDIMFFIFSFVKWDSRLTPRLRDCTPRFAVVIRGFEIVVERTITLQLFLNTCLSMYVSVVIIVRKSKAAWQFPCTLRVLLTNVTRIRFLNIKRIMIITQK